MRNELLTTLDGTILERKYRIDRVIAEGGFGVVYSGHHLVLDVPIAVKVLKPAPSADRLDWPEQVALFLAEAKTLAKLSHPNVVHVLDAGATQVGEAPSLVPWMVLEWLDGKTLRDDLRDRRGRGRSPAECMTLLAPVLEAIADAHDLGIVHRDMKASNVMLVPVGGELVAKVLDFGIAKIMGVDEQRVAPSGDTETSSIGRAFTRASAAPEQLSGTRTGPWTDVFALGLLITEILTGRAPLSVDDANEHYRAVFDPVRPTPAKLGVDVGAWEPVLARALAVAPAARQPNARVLARELEEAAPHATFRGAPPGEASSPDATRDASESGFAGTHRSARVTEPLTGDLRAARERAAEPAHRGGARRRLGVVAIAAIAAAGAAIALPRAVRPGRPTPALDASLERASTLLPAPAPGLVERRLTSLEPNVFIEAVALSRDKARVAFALGGAVWVQQVASGERVRLASLPAGGSQEFRHSLDWFPGDREILVGGETLEAVDVETGARRTLRKEAFPSRLAPDGVRIAVMDPASPGVRIETLDGSLLTTLPPSIPPARVDEVVWAPSGERLAFVLGGKVSRGGEELVVASIDGAHVRTVAAGTLRTSDGVTGVAWPAEDRLLFVRSALRGDGVSFMELRLRADGEPVGAPAVLHQSQHSAYSLSAVSDAIAFVGSETQDDVLVAGLSASGTALTRPFERVTNSDASDTLLDWTSSTRFAFLSNRGNAKGLGVFEQEIGAQPTLIGPGPDIYAFGAAAMTGSGDVLFWRGGSGGDPPGPCQLVRMAQQGGRERVIAADVAAGADDDAALACRARVACTVGRCAVMGAGSVAWLDLETGGRGRPFAPPTLRGARIVSGVAVSRDGHIAVVPDPPLANEQRLTVLRPDGAVDAVVPLPTGVLTIAFALDGRRMYAVDYLGSDSGVIAIDLPGGGVHRLVDRDGRSRGNPRVSPDGARLALSLRSRQTNIGILEPAP